MPDPTAEGGPAISTADLRTSGALALPALTALLSAPWLVHAAVVLASAAGARPLASRATSIGILVAAVVSSSMLAGLVQRRRIGRAPAGASTAPLVRTLSNGLVVAAVAALVIAMVAAALFPIVAYDALGYRLPAMAQWLDAGRIAWVASDDPVRNGYPLGQEAISAVLAAATGSLRFSALPSFFLVASGALSIQVLAEHEGVRAPLSRAAAASFVLVPMNLLNASSGYVDAAFAGAVVALACNAALLDANRETDLVFAGTTGMAAAHALSLKGNGVFIVGVVAVGLAVRALRRRTTARGLTLAGLLALPGTFWLVRNLVHANNPLWPMEVRLAGHLVFPGIRTMDALLDPLHNTPPELAGLSAPLQVLRTWLELGGPARDCDERLAGLGWAWPALAAPSIVVLLRDVLRRERDTREWAKVTFVIAVTAVCFVLQPMRWWPRYTIWVWGPGALSLAALGERLSRARKERGLALGLGLLSAFSVLEGTSAVLRANGMSRALAGAAVDGHGIFDLKDARNASSWVRPELWSLGLSRETDVCRGAWKPGTDDANLDGVLAQLVPRPRMHVLIDDSSSWERVKAEWNARGCSTLLLLSGSPVLASASTDPDVSVEPAVAFDPMFVVRPRRTPRPVEPPSHL